MVTLSSHTEEGKKYFFEGYGLKKETIEAGKCFPKSKGKLINTLEIPTESNQHFGNPDLKTILEDCCPPEIIKVQGVRAAMGFVNAFSKIYDNGK